MKIYEILREGVDDLSIEEILNRDCGKWMAEAAGHVAWRGIELIRKPPPISIATCPVGRKPRNLDRGIHTLVDDWFLEQSGVRFRSNALFTTGSKVDASSYGTRIGIFPIGDYNYAWSPAVEDLFMTFSGYERDDQPAILDIMNQANYQFNKNLIGGIESNCELMINCNTAYMVLPAALGQEE